MREKGAVRWIIVGVTAVCLVAAGFFAGKYFQKRSESALPGSGNSKDHVYSDSLSLGETYTGGDGGNTVVFERAYLTRQIAGARRDTGGYLAVAGKIDTRNFAFVKKNVEMYLSPWDPERPPELAFEEELSRAVSETELFFEEDWGDWTADESGTVWTADGVGTMKGDFSLVFSIDEVNYALLENKVPPVSNGGEFRIVMQAGTGMIRPDRYALWFFALDEVQNVDNIR